MGCTGGEEGVRGEEQEEGGEEGNHSGKKVRETLKTDRFTVSAAHENKKLHKNC